MRKIYRPYLALFMLVFFVSGCGQSDSEYTYAPEQMDALAASVPDDRDLSPAFASDLCVITDEAAAVDSSVSAEAAATFSLSDNQVIVQKNPFERLYPASITKIMTALLAIEDGNLEEEVTVGPETVITESGASLCHINPGDTLSMEELLYGLMLPSGNDAGAAIAVHKSGSIEAFAQRMNEKAYSLGATDTHFVNPHGLTDEQHYTTAYDLYLIFNEALKHPEFRGIIGTVAHTAQYTDAQGQGKTQEWKNSNQYLTGQTPTPEGLTVMGGKTGTTQAAGSCLIIGSLDSEQHEYISVVLKAENRQSLYENMTNIIQKIVN